MTPTERHAFALERQTAQYLWLPVAHSATARGTYTRASVLHDRGQAWRIVHMPTRRIIRADMDAEFDRAWAEVHRVICRHIYPR